MYLGAEPKSYQLDTSQRLSSGARREVFLRVLPQNYHGPHLQLEKNSLLIAKTHYLAIQVTVTQVS